MNLNLDIKADDINRVITEAIVKSAIGEMLQKSVKAAVDKLSQAYDNPVEKVVEQEIMKIVRQVISDSYHDYLTTLVREKLVKKDVDKLVDKLWEATYRNF